VFIVVGAAMALAYDANRVTRDVGATFAARSGSSSCTGSRSAIQRLSQFVR
jgi:hypothetical protein